jgi:hypothetical protein
VSATDRAPDHAHEDVERLWEAAHWSGLDTMPDAERPVDVDDTEERDR